MAELKKQLTEAEQGMPSLIKARDESAAKATAASQASGAAADENAQLHAQMVAIPCGFRNCGSGLY